MDQFFTEQDSSAPQITEYQPPQTFISNNQPQTVYQFQSQATEPNTFNFSSQITTQTQPAFNYNDSAENDFNDFEEDQTTRRIREEEQRVQNLLREKSQREYRDKGERIALGRKILEEFIERKKQEKQERARQNLQKEEQVRQQYNKMKGQDGWHKVISSINVRQGEHKGKKDTNRMREVILHRREDQTGK